ncbi:alkylglycerol monooxygenase isoform X2 [Ornithorhynchus anatinus]|uniref:Alkylglycerol monooxygenase n=1 Tax=Ornithorhynchus anatinus TaxID=9258 RepID=K7EHX7_ORNAN|nr:alkylglycerol monooxygenase isoform X2 [Ornithorhynchus anatinus]
MGDQEVISFSQGIRMMFYVMKPNETSFQSIEEVPDYVKKATPFFISLLLLEFLVSWIHQGKPASRVDDALTSLSAGVLSRLPSLFFRSFEISSYIYIWENFRLFGLPWDSPWTWYLTFLGVDFGYYWFHRMAHEVNIMWAGHQTHHSSEDYNLSTALRQSVIQIYTSWLIDHLGPLELILNTPSHHRVHHGRNRYCIDKNYGGTLIIWDRIFGTFEAEKEKVLYGLTHPINTFEPFKVQFHHLVDIWTTFWITPGFTDKFSVLFKGPGWGPGKPRLGLPEEIPEVTGKEVPFSAAASGSLQLYTIIHFVIMLGFYEETFSGKATLTQITLLLRICYIILTITSIGFLIEKRPRAAIMETARCSIFLMLYRFGFLKPFFPALTAALEIVFSICVSFWGARTVLEFRRSS